MKFDISHIITFLVGGLGGAAAHYLGTKFTEQRHRQERRAATQKEFAEILAKMPDLLAEMKGDVTGDQTQLIREFFLLPSKSASVRSLKKRFAYFSDEHEGLQGRIDILEDHNYVVNVTTGRVPIYRMTDQFVELLKNM